MKAIWRIVKIILVFFLSLAIIAFAWYAVEIATLEKAETPVPFIDFILYLLGFGDLDSNDHYLQTLFSTLGLFSVTLLSSVFTVNLFELRSKVKIAPMIIVKSKNCASIMLKASGKDVYNLTATLIAKCGNEVSTDEQVFPFILKKTLQELEFDIAPGTVIYKYLRTVYLKKDENPQLILKITYTDIESGQEYSMAQKYQYFGNKNRNIVFCKDKSDNHNESFEKSVRESIENNTFNINLASIWPCEAEDIDISYGYQDDKIVLSQKETFTADIHMNSNRTYEPQTFTMAVTNDLLENDWSTYYDLGCALKFDYKIIGDLAVTIELKYGTTNTIKYEQILHPKNKFQTFTLELQKFNREELKNIKELCFTVFYKDVNPKAPFGRFIIKKCVLEVE